MKKLIFGAVALAAIGIQSANAGPSTAKPDPARVKYYTDNVDARNAKLTECKSRNDLVAILTDVECVSADQVIRAKHQAMLTSKCNAADTFVYVSPNLNAIQRSKYLEAHMPSDEALSRCGLTKGQWLDRENNLETRRR
jgi:hypothetical protein